MINAVRNLLLNISGDAVVPDWVIGEDLVDLGYRAAVDLYPAIRACLFGSAPDRNYLNYRLAQYLPLLHATALAEYVTALDPRVTYLQTDRSDLYLPGKFTPAVAIGPAGVAFEGVPVISDASGHMFWRFGLTVLDSVTIEVRQQRPTPADDFFAYTVTDGLSAPVPLGASGYSVVLPEVSPGTYWQIDFNNRPGTDVGSVLAAAKVIGEPTLLELFQPGEGEPYKTFSNCFYAHPEAAYQLGGLLLALAYRTGGV